LLPPVIDGATGSTVIDDYFLENAPTGTVFYEFFITYHAEGVRRYQFSD
jgi:hypothetical protein